MLTDINPAAQISEPTPAASEDDDEYDMSMIVDATRQTIDEDLTEKDLNAIPVEDYAVADDTLHTKVDLQTLEQDYQDEYTATLAAQPGDRASCRRTGAADERCGGRRGGHRQSRDRTGPRANGAHAGGRRPGTDAGDDVGSRSRTDRTDAGGPRLEPTAQMPAEPGLEPTAQMPADPGMEPTPEMPIDAGLDPTAEMSVSTSDSGVNAELTDSIPIDIDALNDALAAEDITARVAAAGAEATVEMPARPDEKKSEQ